MSLTSGSKTVILTGTGAPSALLGFPGDFYLDTAAQALYRKDPSTGWGLAVATVPTFPGNVNQFLNGNGAFTSIPLAALAALITGTSLANNVNEGTIFTGNGNFTPGSTANYLVIAIGGGAGGGGGVSGASGTNAGQGGKGGTSGNIGFSIQALTAATPYAVVIGSGGAGGVSVGGASSPGNNTTFNGVNIAAGGAATVATLLRGGTNTAGCGDTGGGYGGGIGGATSGTVGLTGGNGAANTGGGGGGGGGGIGTSAGGTGGTGGSGILIVIRA